MTIERFLALLAELRDADQRLADAGRDPVKRQAALRDVRRLERQAFGGALEPGVATLPERGIIL